jgi:hypothetical protein
MLVAIACFCLVQGQQSNTRGGPFAVLNGSMVADVLVVALPAGAKLQQQQRTAAAAALL